MRLRLHTETVIDSCHRLEGYCGKCVNLHGHSWKIEIEFEGDSADRDPVGILVDFGIVAALKEELDHKYLNDVIGHNPTAENLTMWVKEWLRAKVKPSIQIFVRVYETAVGKTTWCENVYGTEEE